MATKALTITYGADAKGVASALDSIDKSHANTTSKFAALSGSFGMLKGSLGELAAGFGPLGEVAAKAGEGLDHVKEKFGELEGASKKAGAVMVGAGAALTGIGALGVAIGEKQEQATKTLEVAIKNTGGSYEEYAKSINKAVSAGEKNAHGAADTKEALAKLTTALGDTKKATDEMGLVDEVAAKKHISLADAADQVLKIHQGASKVLKQYGIDTTGLTNASKDATKLEKEHAAAVDALAKLQEKSGDAAVLAGAKAQDAGAKAAASAVSHTTSTTKAHEASAAAIQKAEDAVAAAKERGLQVDERVSAKAKQTVSDHQAVENAATAVSKAEDNLAAVKGKGAAASTSASSAHAALGATHLSTAAAAIKSKTEHEALAAAQAKVDATAKALTAAHAGLASATAKGSYETQVMEKIHGTAAAQADTFGMKIAALKTHVLDVAGAFGAKFGPAITTAGPLIMGVGALMESNLIPKVIMLGGEIIGTAAMWVSSWLSMAAGTVSAMIGIDISTGGLLLILGAIIAGVILVWKNWDTIWGFIKGIVSDAVDWIKGHLVLVMALVAPFLLPFYEMWKHWGEIWSGMQDALGVFLAFWSVVWSGVQKVLSAVWGVIKPIIDGITRGIGDVVGAIKSVAGVGGAVAHVLGFQAGGTVPGPVGAPVLAMVHGGEEISPVGSSRAGGGGGDTYVVNVVVQGNAVYERQLGDVVYERLLEIQRRQGTLAFH